MWHANFCPWKESNNPAPGGNSLDAGGGRTLNTIVYRYCHRSLASPWSAWVRQHLWLAIWPPLGLPVVKFLSVNTSILYTHANTQTGTTLFHTNWYKFMCFSWGPNILESTNPIDSTLKCILISTRTCRLCPMQGSWVRGQVGIETQPELQKGSFFLSLFLLF